MVEIARQHGSAVKFPGSGGAVVGLCLDTFKMESLRRTLQSEGFVVCDAEVHCGGNQHQPPPRRISVASRPAGVRTGSMRSDDSQSLRDSFKHFPVIQPP